MAPRRIAIIDGHPDPDPARFVHALTDRYAEGARTGGHLVRRVSLAELQFTPIATRHEWEGDDIPADIRRAHEEIAWAEHIVILYPLWLGDVPAILKGFLEQVARPGFAFRYRRSGLPEKLLKGRSARLVVTMGMPAFFYRYYYGAHSVKSLDRNILRFVGIRPIGHTLIGNVEADAAKRDAWLARMEKLGRSAL